MRYGRGLKILVSLMVFGLVVSAFGLSAFADPLDSIQILQISSQDERAIIKTRDGELKVVKVGDSIGQNGKITEITKGRVVIEEETANGLETIIIRVEDGKQNIERIKKVADKPPLLYKPQADIKE